LKFGCRAKLKAKKKYKKMIFPVEQEMKNGGGLEREGRLVRGLFVNGLKEHLLGQA
jgi:hypothetical protein